MKINEVINEALNQDTGTPNSNPAPAQKPGLWNKLKAGIAGARAGMQQRRDTKAIAKGAGARANQANIKLELDAYNRYLAQTLNGSPVTPQVLQATSKRFVSNRYPSTSPEVFNSGYTVKDLKSAQNYIAQNYNSAMTNRAAGIKPAEQPAQADQVEQPAQAEPNTNADWKSYDQPAFKRREKNVSKPEYHPGSTEPIDPSLLGNNQVQVAGHGIITKGPDGQWRDEQEDVISRPEDVKELERRLTQRLQTKQMARPQAPFQPGAPRRPRSKKARRK